MKAHKKERHIDEFDMAHIWPASMSHPHLKVKASASNALVPFVCAVAQEAAAQDPQNAKKLHAAAAMSNLRDLCALSRQGSMTSTDVKKCENLCLLVGQHAQLAGFHLVPKFHLMCHLASQIARTGEPRETWIY